MHLPSQYILSVSIMQLDIICSHRTKYKNDEKISLLNFVLSGGLFQLQKGDDENRIDFSYIVEKLSGDDKIYGANNNTLAPLCNAHTSSDLCIFTYIHIVTIESSII